MTIAIHLLAGITGASVTATDTQETYNTGQIVDTGKIAGLWRADPLGAINVTGAGDSPYIDALSQNIIRRFENFRGSAAEWEALVRRTVARFYRTHILPFVGTFEDRNVPSCELLVASRHASVTKLWTTHETLVIERTPFDCVGIGSPTAESLLNHLYPRYPSLDSVAVLAAYVIHRVKASVEGCGLGTEIRFIFNDRMGIVPPDLIDQWEQVFRRYDRLAQEMFFHAMNFDPHPSIPAQLLGELPSFPSDMRPLEETVADIEAMRTEFNRLRVFSPARPTRQSRGGGTGNG